MEKIDFKTPLDSCEIQIESGLLKRLGAWMDEHCHKCKVAIVIDANLNKIFGPTLKEQLPQALILEIPASEDSKSFEMLESLAKELLDSHFTRSDMLIGFGGGMTTDLAGFLASIYMRGIRYVNFPTSLLGMADAAIGGKTAINLGAKNVIGTTYLPDYVLIDPDLLSGLPEKEIITGLAEISKYGFILDPTVLDLINADSIDYSALIKKSAAAKVDVTTKDLKEGGRRKILNYGHTLGHAIEAKTDHAYTHGEAISIGMVLANNIAQNLGKQSVETGEEIKATLKKIGLPTELPEDIKPEDLIEYVKNDKKRVGDSIEFIIVPEIGNAEIVPIKIDDIIGLCKKS